MVSWAISVFVVALLILHDIVIDAVLLCFGSFFDLQLIDWWSSQEVQGVMLLFLRCVGGLFHRSGLKHLAFGF